MNNFHRPITDVAEGEYKFSILMNDGHTLEVTKTFNCFGCYAGLMFPAEQAKSFCQEALYGRGLWHDGTMHRSEDAKSITVTVIRERLRTKEKE